MDERRARGDCSCAGSGRVGSVTVHATAAGAGRRRCATGITNITTKVVVQTAGPDWARAACRFSTARAGQPAAAAPAVTWLGVTTEVASDELRAQLSLDPGVGSPCPGVAPGGPAANAWPQVHDVLTRFGDQILMDPDQLKNLVRAKKAGDRATLAYPRKRVGRRGRQAGASTEPAADVLHVINLGDFSSVDVNQLMQQMPQIQRQISARSRHLDELQLQRRRKGGRRLAGRRGGILKNLKFDDTNASRMVEETLRKALKDVPIEAGK